LSLSTSIWILNGIVWFRRQDRPSKARISFDYGYSLALEQVTAAFDAENTINTLEFRFKHRNTANGPVLYKIEKLIVRVNDRIAEGSVRGAVMSRGMSLLSLLDFGFTKNAVDSFQDRPLGRLEYSAIYGHPEFGCSRANNTNY
jgi:hypothetical protein